ncbi:DNA sulfur modification protein DndB [Paenibacillus planticolens]|uniref:Uncharacterized protein n=1 Tax=Paenibacillus planticolens TaxID=2654976 RepID=A0ABX1ZHD3_9BACL|nr:DNA sulfur modification protein DndB [Paenibacillus planticolens]NOU99491.1 hypothetical protein [Paenibacillus planticolens]
MSIGCVELTNVDYLGNNRYKGTIQLKTLYHAMKRPYVMYCPATQRGEYDPENPDYVISADYNHFHSITYPYLALDESKVNEMTVQYLRNQLYWSDLIWNARVDEDLPTSLEYDENLRTLRIYSTITMPDSAHRHRAYYRIFEWCKEPEKIPSKVELTQIGVTITRSEIESLLQTFDPNKAESVTVHHLNPEKEGELFRQLNNTTKKANPAQVIRVNPDMNAVTRTINRLYSQCEVFNRLEIEETRTTIHSKSRKLVPNSTLQEAIKQYAKLLADLETHEPGAYQDLLDCITDFFKRLSQFYPEMKPGADRETRWHSRKMESFIIENVMFHALFKIVFETWKAFNNRSQSWKNDPLFIRIVNGLSKNIRLPDHSFVNIMSRRNPNWVGRIVNHQGRISNNRPSQAAAFDYLSDEIGLTTLRNPRVRPTA